MHVNIHKISGLSGSIVHTIYIRTGYVGFIFSGDESFWSRPKWAAPGPRNETRHPGRRNDGDGQNNSNDKNKYLLAKPLPLLYFIFLLVFFVFASAIVRRIINTIPYHSIPYQTEPNQRATKCHKDTQYYLYVSMGHGCLLSGPVLFMLVSQSVPDKISSSRISNARHERNGKGQKEQEQEQEISIITPRMHLSIDAFGLGWMVKMKRFENE